MLNIKKTLTKILQTIKYTEKRTLLWTNENPTTAYAAGTILNSGELEGYDFVEINGRIQTGGPIGNITRIKMGQKGVISYTYMDSQKMVGTVRDVDVQTTGITFGAGYVVASSSKTQNNYMSVPLHVYGVKFN